MPDALAALGPDLLASLVGRLPALGSSVPARRYVHAGEVAYDCEQLVVAFERAAPGMVGVDQVSPRPVGAVYGRMATLAVHLVRCVPTMTDRGQAPATADLTAVATQQFTDALALPMAMRAGLAASEWGSLCDSVLWAETVPNGPLGGYSGIIMRVNLQV